MDAIYLAWSAVLLFAMVLVAGLWKYRAWTLSGLNVMMSNRGNVPEYSPAAKRADKAASNMLENIPLLIALVAAAHFLGKSGEQTALGAAIFFWARLVYWPVYVIGIPYLRTLVWGVAIAGCVVIALALL